MQHKLYYLVCVLGATSLGVFKSWASQKRGQFGKERHSMCYAGLVRTHIWRLTMQEDRILLVGAPTVDPVECKETKTKACDELAFSLCMPHRSRVSVQA